MAGAQVRAQTRTRAPRTRMPDYKIPSVRLATSDAVPTVWLPSDGPFFGMLRFQSGSANETMQTVGINHLVEHLALSTISRGALEFNGYVNLQSTNFFATGKRADVVRFLHNVCAALHDLPLDRLEAELRVLRVECDQRATTEIESHMAARFGPAAYGLCAYREFGFDTVTPESIQEHVRRNFSADNAVLMLTGSPRGVGLDLPRGKRIPLPKAVPVITDPGWIRTTNSMLAATWLTERSPAASWYLSIIERRVSEKLRHEQGASYSTQSNVERFDHKHHAALVSTVLPDLKVDATTEFLKVLCEYEITDEDIESLRKRGRQAAAQVPPATYWLDLAANDLLRDGAVRDNAAEMKQVWSLTPADYNEFAAQARATTLLSLPEGAPTRGTKCVSAPPADSISGKTFHPKLHRWKFKDRVRVVVGDDGIGRLHAKDHWTVRWDDVAGVLKYSGGERTLVDNRGRALTFMPSEHFGGQQATRLIDAHTPAGMGIDLNEPPPVSAVQPRSQRMKAKSDAFIYLVTAAVLFWTYICISLVFEEHDGSYLMVAAPAAWFGVFTGREAVRRTVYRLRGGAKAPE